MPSGIRKTTKTFIEHAKEVHGDKFDYSKVEYKTTNDKVLIKCNTCGDEFWQIAKHHTQGYGCFKCTRRVQSDTREQFIEKAKEVHGNKYDYSKVEYTNSRTKVCIICPNFNHGEFWQTPTAHLHDSNGCSKCHESKGEEIIRVWLEHNNIDFNFQKNFNECRNPLTNRPLLFDFYLPKFNMCIEFDGKQHFKESVGDQIYWKKSTSVFSLSDWLDISYRDDLKNQYCLKNNIKLLRIAYKQSNIIYKILQEHLLERGKND